MFLFCLISILLITALETLYIKNVAFISCCINFLFFAWKYTVYLIERALNGQPLTIEEMEKHYEIDD